MKLSILGNLKGNRKLLPIDGMLTKLLKFSNINIQFGKNVKWLIVWLIFNQDERVYIKTISFNFKGPR